MTTMRRLVLLDADRRDPAAVVEGAGRGEVAGAGRGEVAGAGRGRPADGVERLAEPTPLRDGELVALPEVAALLGRLGDEDAERLAARPGVRAVLPDTPLGPLGTDEAADAPEHRGGAGGDGRPMHLERVRALRAWRHARGRHVRVAVLDTGVARDHPALPLGEGAAFVEGTADPADRHGHGTHCAGLVGARVWHRPDGRGWLAGVAPACTLHGLKIADRGRPSYDGDAVAALLWAHRAGMDVVAFGLGRPVEGPDAAPAPLLRRAVRVVHDGGALVVAAAGNSGRQGWRWVNEPARCPEALAVAAVDGGGHHADFSSYGPAELPPEQGVALAAPGVRVPSTDLAGGVRRRSGTSQAAPQVAGAAALVRARNPEAGPATVARTLIASAQPLSEPSERVGAGLLDGATAVELRATASAASAAPVEAGRRARR